MQPKGGKRGQRGRWKGQRKEERKLEAYDVNNLRKFLNSYADMWHFKLLVYIESKESCTCKGET